MLRRWYVPAIVTLPDGTDILAISLHNPAYQIEHTVLKGVDVSHIRLKAQPRDIWLLDVVFYFLKNMVSPNELKQPPLIVGGDFNSSLKFDARKPRGNAEFFDRIASEGFVSLHRCFHDEDERTFFGRGKHQLDYLYADRSLAAHATGCWVVPRDKVKTFSDHSPLVADLACPESGGHLREAQADQLSPAVE